MDGIWLHLCDAQPDSTTRCPNKLSDSLLAGKLVADSFLEKSAHEVGSEPPPLLPWKGIPERQSSLVGSWRLHPQCTHESFVQFAVMTVRPVIYGVPGGVRTCNLPLRRGMLYPIELLRHCVPAHRSVPARTACILAACTAFVMSSLPSRAVADVATKQS